jgi:RNA polymerase sigma-70 factor, ECF subfamily
MGVMSQGKEKTVSWFKREKPEPRYEDSELAKTIEKNKQQLYRIAYSYVKNEQDALDVVQETVCRAIASQDSLREPAYMKSWLVRILINCALDVCKRNNRIQGVAPETMENQPSKEAGVGIDERMDLQRALDELEEPQKTLIHLRFFEDMTLEETARVMDMPLGTVKSHIYRTLNRLKLELGEVSPMNNRQEVFNEMKRNPSGNDHAGCTG